MAGIGFELNKLREKDALFSPVMSVGHSAVIAAGPWLFTVAALGAINAAAASLMSLQALSSFRAIVIYAFLLSQVATAPIIMLSVRLLSDAIFLEQFHRVRAIFITTLVVCCAASAAVAVVVEGILFGLNEDLLLAGVRSSMLTGLIWVSLAFCSAVRDFNAVTLSFIGGLTAAVILAVGGAASGTGVSGLTGRFDLGLGVIFFGLALRVLLTFPQPMLGMRGPLGELLTGLTRYKELALGALAGAMAAWIDKWIIWLGPSGEKVVGGLLNAPSYDSAMFFGFLSIIPALGLFVSVLETSFFKMYTNYFDLIGNHATLDAILVNGKSMSKNTFNAAAQILLLQLIISVIAILCAPILAPALGLQYSQISILRFGIVGALFHLAFIIFTSLLLYFQRYREYMRLQVLFLVLNALGTLGTQFIGPQTYGFGYLAACATSSIAALIVLEKTMEDVAFLTFVAGTASPSAGTSPREEDSILPKSFRSILKRIIP